MTRSSRRFALVAAVVLVVLPLLLIAGLHLAARQIQAQVVAALGPRASIGSIDLGWTGVTVRDLRIKAPPDWPAEDELRATRMRIVPDLRSLVGGRWRISRVKVDGAYLSMRRARDGRVHLLPALLGEPQRKPQLLRRGALVGEAPLATPPITIGEVELDDATLAFFDASVQQRPPLPLRIERLQAKVGPLRLPALDRPIRIRLEGVFKGTQRDGRIAIAGEYTPARHDADIQARFSDVELAPLRPYLLKLSEIGVRQGTLDLELHATVVDNQLHAPGKLTLTNLEIADRGPLSLLTDAPRRAVLAAMTEQGRLEVKFTLEGRLDDPAFSLNENLAVRFASGLAETLGVSFSGVVKGLGGLVDGLLRR
jgi:uncharacterized protein involved in outer membrane biogenesis